MSDYRTVEEAVIQWAKDRKIIPNSNPAAQARKTNEEVGELVASTAQLKLLEQLKAHLPEIVYLSHLERIKDQIKDDLGDVMVTLVNAAALANVSLVNSFAGAYEVIKDRKGTLLPNGIFQKEV
jgi:NTP pyrophosphatase (non-canonical NTP hydrolase)